MIGDGICPSIDLRWKPPGVSRGSTSLLIALKMITFLDHKDKVNRLTIEIITVVHLDKHLKAGGTALEGDGFEFLTTFDTPVGMREHLKSSMSSLELMGRVLFIGTQFRNLYTAVDTPARGRVVCLSWCRLWRQTGVQLIPHSSMEVPETVRRLQLKFCGLLQVSRMSWFQSTRIGEIGNVKSLRRLDTRAELSSGIVRIRVVSSSALPGNLAWFPG